MKHIRHDSSDHRCCKHRKPLESRKVGDMDDAEICDECGGPAEELYVKNGRWVCDICWFGG